MNSTGDTKTNQHEAEVLEIDIPRQYPRTPGLKLLAIEAKADHISILPDTIIPNQDPLENKEDGSQKQLIMDKEPMKTQHFERIGKTLIFFLFLTIIIICRHMILQVKVSCIEDKILNLLQFANDFINKEGNENYRILFQATCSLLVDLSFILTFGYWVLHGKTCRLPISLAFFYLVRALVQSLWESPFPPGYYWYSPGFPSLVVPYGRGSDFFFSGHTGFMTICAEEWHRLGRSRMRNLILCFTVYTMLILMMYRIHYSIDLFVGLFFADWCFWKVDAIRGKLDTWWVNIFINIKIYSRKLRTKYTRRTSNQ